MEIFSESLLLQMTGPLLAVFDWVDVDRVRFVTSGGEGGWCSDCSDIRHFGIDDLTITAPTTATPEPASMALLVTGLAVLGAARRRRRKEPETF